MFSMRSALIMCCALFLAAVAGAQVARDQAASGSTTTSDARHIDVPACAATTTAEPDDPRWRWRLRAYNHLDCVTAIVDKALEQAKTSDGRPDDENATVTMTRADLERIRTLTWWARDAAARIGQ